MRDLQVAGDRALGRWFTLFVPKHLAPGERVPLLVLLHGLGEARRRADGRLRVARALLGRRSLSGAGEPPSRKHDMTIAQFQYTHVKIPAEPEAVLDSWVGEMLATNDLESLFDSNPTVRITILKATRNVAHRAFVESEPAALLAAHRTLYRLYEQNVRTPAKAVLVNQFDPTLVQIRRILERAWECRERSRLTFSQGNLSGPEQFLATHRRLLDNHRVRTHPLSDYLADEATSADLAQYVTSSGLLNLRFFDLIALALVGLTSDQMRHEIVGNLVDENAAPGTKSHTSLVLASMNSTGYTTDPDEVAGSIGWEALAGYNAQLSPVGHATWAATV